jgi:hypothetical protein
MGIRAKIEEIQQLNQPKFVQQFSPRIAPRLTTEQLHLETIIVNTAVFRGDTAQPRISLKRSGGTYCFHH